MAAHPAPVAVEIPPGTPGALPAHLADQLTAVPLRRSGTVATCDLDPDRHSAVFAHVAPLAAAVARSHWPELPDSVTATAKVIEYRPGDYLPPHRDTDTGGPTVEALALAFGTVDTFGLNVTAQRTCSATVMLNDGFDGGELVVIDDDGNEIELSPAAGGIVVFPADRLHRVAPVVSGRRRTLAVHCSAAANTTPAP